VKDTNYSSVAPPTPNQGCCVVNEDGNETENIEGNRITRRCDDINDG